MSELIAGLDQGTSSTRCVVLDEALSERGVASVAVESSFPAPGMVEQDAEALAASAERAIAAALAAAGATAGGGPPPRHPQPTPEVGGWGPPARRPGAPAVGGAGTGGARARA